MAERKQEDNAVTGSSTISRIQGDSRLFFWHRLDPVSNLLDPFSRPCCLFQSPMGWNERAFPILIPGLSTVKHGVAWEPRTFLHLSPILSPFGLVKTERDTRLSVHVHRYEWRDACGWKCADVDTRATFSPAMRWRNWYKRVDIAVLLFRSGTRFTLFVMYWKCVLRFKKDYKDFPFVK